VNVFGQINKNITYFYIVRNINKALIVNTVKLALLFNVHMAL